ncbi:MAG: acetyl-CoA C-acetyltransferase [Candidatus Neomarinimicrobiota bacterium]
MIDLKEIVIVSAKRTPIGAFQGILSTVPAAELGAVVIRSIMDETGLNPGIVDEVIFGNVLMAGQGQAPARQAALKAGLPNTVECFTVNKMCGSGLKSVMLAAQAIQTGDADIIISGGMENMSLAPYLLPSGRSGYRLGHGKLLDSVIVDGLWDVYTDQHMGKCAELCVQEKKYTREVQDNFARRSYTRAQEAHTAGWFKNEISPVLVPQRKKDSILESRDEEPLRANFEKMKSLKPAFAKDGTITAANASKINDGAAAVLVMSKNKALELGLKPLVKIITQGSAAHASEWFTTAPSKAIAKVLRKSGLEAQNIDLWEINEAFAPVALAAMEDFDLDQNKVNIHGGAIALGHPIGASGARILTTLIHALVKNESRYGLAVLCIGGGEASALIIERI